MKVLFLFGGGYPNGGAMAKRLHLYCCGLKALSCEVSILIPHESERYGKTINSQIEGIFEGVPFKYVSNKTTRSRWFLFRRFHDFIGNFRTLFYLLFNVGRDRTLVLVDIRSYLRFFVIIVARLRNQKVVLELNEHPLITSTVFDYFLDRWITYRLLNGFIVISNALSDLIKKHIGIYSVNKIIVVPIVSRPHDRSNIELSVPDMRIPYVLHSGSIIEQKDGVEGMLTAFALVQKSIKYKFRFYFTGSIEDSPDRDSIKRTIEKYSLNDSVLFLGKLTEQQLNFYQANSSLFIINKHDNFQNRFCFPTKLAEYLSHGRPVIVTCVGELKSYFEDRVNAFVLKPGNTQSITAAMIYILEHPTEGAAVGQRGKALASSLFDYKIQGKRLLNFLQGL